MRNSVLVTLMGLFLFLVPASAMAQDTDTQPVVQTPSATEHPEPVSADTVNQVANILSQKDYLSKVNPTVRYLVDTSRQMLPGTLATGQDLFKQLAEQVCKQVVLLGVAGLVWNGSFVLLGLIVMLLGYRTWRDPHTWEDVATDPPVMGTTAYMFMIGGIGLCVISLMSCRESLVQVFAPGAWIIQQVLSGGY